MWWPVLSARAMEFASFAGDHHPNLDGVDHRICDFFQYMESRWNLLETESNLEGEKICP